MNPVSSTTPTLPRRHSSPHLNDSSAASSNTNTSRLRPTVEGVPSAKPKEATAHLDLAARDSKIKKLREKFLTADHRLHLAQQAQAGEVLSKLLLKQVGEDATYPLRKH